MGIGILDGVGRRVALFGVAACLCAASAAMAGPANAAVRVRKGGGATAGSALREAEQVARYWTPARMRNTPPLEGGAGGGEALADASFTIVPEATATVPPYSVNGRLFVRQGGEQGYCSATAINSPTRQLVLTAGHCVNSGPQFLNHRGIWSNYLEFVPAYSGGVAPFGAFVARRNKIFSPKPWVRHGNSNFDIGAFLTLPNANGQNVADAVGGGATIALDQDRHQTFQTFGYPGPTRRLNTCTSSYTGDDRVTYGLAGPPTMAIRCRWIPGASGGGWLIAEGTQIDGLTSYGLRNDRVHTFGPYFGSGNVGALVAGL